MTTFPILLDHAGVAVFAASGALTAARKRLDIVGFCLVATVTGIGGGTLRDLLVGNLPVYWVQQPSYALLCLTVAVIVFFAAPHLERVCASCCGRTRWAWRCSASPARNARCRRARRC